MIFPKISNKYLEDFIRGYFDGDGSINTGLTIVSTLTFCQSLKDILPCTITNIYQRYKDREPDKSSHQLFVGKRKEVQKIYTWMYDNATIWLERKRLQF